jgi:hypothetical protein
MGNALVKSVVQTDGAISKLRKDFESCYCDTFYIKTKSGKRLASLREQTNPNEFLFAEREWFIGEELRNLCNLLLWLESGRIQYARELGFNPTWTEWSEVCVELLKAHLDEFVRVLNVAYKFADGFSFGNESESDRVEAVFALIEDGAVAANEARKRIAYPEAAKNEHKTAVDWEVAASAVVALKLAKYAHLKDKRGRNSDITCAEKADFIRAYLEADVKLAKEKSFDEVPGLRELCAKAENLIEQYTQLSTSILEGILGGLKLSGYKRCSDKQKRVIERFLASTANVSATNVTLGLAAVPTLNSDDWDNLVSGV